MILLSNNMLQMTRGDSEALRVTVTDREGNPRPLQEGDRVELTIRKDPRAPEKLLHKVVTEFDEGAAIIPFNPEDTARIPFGRYSYDVQLTLANGMVKTIVKPTTFVIGEEDTYE